MIKRKDHTVTVITVSRSQVVVVVVGGSDKWIDKRGERQQQSKEVATTVLEFGNLYIFGVGQSHTLIWYVSVAMQN